MTLRETAREYAEFESDEAAEETIHAVLETLAERVSKGEAEDLAEELPESYAETLRMPAPRNPQKYSLPEFLDRVERRSDVEHGDVEEKTSAVMSTVADAVSGAELERARDQLPAEYDTLFEEPTQ